MQVKIVKIYAWINATPTSKKVRTKRTAIGNKFTISIESPIKIMLKLNPTITFNKVCPAIILAKSRTERLTNLKVYEINSIGIRRKSNGNGHPAGINKRKKNASPCLRNIIVCNDTKIANATQKVNIKLLVPVSEYGNIPIKLLMNTKPKMLDTLTRSSPFPSTSFPRLAKKSGATTSSIKSDSSSSKMKSSSSSSSNKSFAL